MKYFLFSKRTRLLVALSSSWSQSYDFGINNYNASAVAVAVVGKSVFQKEINYFCFQNTLGYSWRCKFLTALAL
jgi:hypothetical protein